MADLSNTSSPYLLITRSPNLLTQNCSFSLISLQENFKDVSSPSPHGRGPSGTMSPGGPPANSNGGVKKNKKKKKAKAKKAEEEEEEDKKKVKEEVDDEFF
ncbi:hypothetical protein H634G_08634 [Metarhizium anisopliae BRIP 53293]|uniref:Uncharacterized protein n=1 Tax=Metarhizium anisopliae BRIP 53293 TaxID=1291518 RepID=A0A0D9NR40_METAN|nr:hypothetical protein H634G_08634 [Metarhizium anisopliae BRIP 53293]